MLRRILTGSVLSLLVGVTGVVVTGSPAYAQGISCGSGQQAVEIGGEWVCVLVAGGGATTGGGTIEVEVTDTGGAVQQWCENRAGVAPDGLGGAPEGMVPCHIEGLGWWDGYDCYYLHLAGTDPVDLPEIAGEDPSDIPGYDEYAPDGLSYRVRCYLEHMGGQDLWNGSSYRVLPEPPEFEGGEPPVVLELWADAVNQLVLGGPEIGMAPPNGVGLVRLPVWMWDEGASSDEATAGPVLGQSVRAWANIESIEWNPGDGEQSMVCDQGVAYEPGMGLFDSDCLHQYSRPSGEQPFQVVATTTWHLEWEVNGAWDGELFLDAASAVDIQINELQVLTGHP